MEIREQQTLILYTVYLTGDQFSHVGKLSSTFGLRMSEKKSLINKWSMLDLMLGEIAEKRRPA
jgi:hypothetical protein